MLEVRNLCRHFGGIRAVDDCSFGVEEGSITALISPNGAGKTTAFNCISGALKPTGGQQQILAMARTPVQNAVVGLRNADYGYVLDLGRALFEGTSDEILSDPRIQELYLGRPKAAG